MNSSGWSLARVSHAVCSDGWSHMKVGCPGWLLLSPSGILLGMLGAARDGWASLCLCSFSTAWRSRVFRRLTWHLTSSRASFPKAPDRLVGFLWLSFWNHIVSLLPCFSGYPETAQIYMEGDCTRAGVSGVWFIVEGGIFGDWVQCITWPQSRVLPHWLHAVWTALCSFFSIVLCACGNNLGATLSLAPQGEW